MQLLISDANILIDMEEGGLLASMFSLDCEFLIPDILFYEELEELHPHLVGMGLKIQPLSSELVARGANLAAQYTKPGRNDLFALALAEHSNCPLLTGDANLRMAAKSENIEVRGTIWLMEQMVCSGLSFAIARTAYEQMKARGRRLPWDVAEAGLRKLEQNK